MRARARAKRQTSNGLSLDRAEAPYCSLYSAPELDRSWYRAYTTSNEFALLCGTGGEVTGVSARTTYSADRERNRHDLTIVDRAGGGVPR